MNSVHGALVVDKPEGPTSHDIVYRARKLLKTKTGHTGTLDPLATGVLPLLLGKATRLMRFYSDHDKVYQAEVKLGETTDTCDRAGQIISSQPVPRLDSETVEEVLSKFRGEIQQVPPMYSAVKVDGERLYRAARRGEIKQRRPRTVRIHSLDLLDRGEVTWTIRVHCSTGTYVRTLAHDIGRTLGCGAHLSRLRRLRSGPFDLSKVVSLEDLDECWRQAYYPLEELLPDFPRVELENSEVLRVQHGNALPGEGHEAGYYRLFHANNWVALAEVRDAKFQPILVFQSGG
jgi:tRNA pseudouridine55 synthase